MTITFSERMASLELKVRHVRTPAGQRRFDQPIGSIIVADGSKLPGLTIGDSDVDGWDLVKGSDGKEYYVGKEDGKWYATEGEDWDKVRAEGKNSDEVYKNLSDFVVAGTKKKPADKPAFERGQFVRIGNGQQNWKIESISRNGDIHIQADSTRSRQPGMKPGQRRVIPAAEAGKLNLSEMQEFDPGSGQPFKKPGGESRQVPGSTLDSRIKKVESDYYDFDKYEAADHQVYYVDQANGHVYDANDNVLDNSGNTTWYLNQIAQHSMGEVEETKPPTRWVDRDTGRVIQNPSQVDIVRGQVVQEGTAKPTKPKINTVLPKRNDKPLGVGDVVKIGNSAHVADWEVTHIYPDGSFDATSSGGGTRIAPGKKPTRNFKPSQITSVSQRAGEPTKRSGIKPKPVALQEALYATELARDDGYEAGFDIEDGKVIVTDARAAVENLTSLMQIADDNADPNTGLQLAADRAKARRKADALKDLVDKIKAHNFRDFEAPSQNAVKPAYKNPIQGGTLPARIRNAGIIRGGPTGENFESAAEKIAQAYSSGVDEEGFRGYITAAINELQAALRRPNGIPTKDRPGVQKWIIELSKAVGASKKSFYDVLMAIEFKVRRVRTAAGAEFYDQPIGSVIRPDAGPSPDLRRARNTVRGHMQNLPFKKPTSEANYTHVPTYGGQGERREDSQYAHVHVPAAELKAARKVAINKAQSLRPPHEDEISDNKARVRDMRSGKDTQSFRDLRGNNIDRDDRSWAMYVEFGGVDEKGKDRGYVPCVYCGNKMSWHDKSKYPKFEQDKILTTEMGGKYRAENLLPVCSGCNKLRNDTPLWKGKGFEEAKPSWFNPTFMKLVTRIKPKRVAFRAPRSNNKPRWPKPIPPGLARGRKS